MMNRYFFMVMLVCFCSLVKAQEQPVFVDAKWLKDHIHDPKVVIVQVNFLKPDYEKEHIEGARFLWPAWLAPDSPEGSFNAPDVKKASEILAGLGISNDSHVVLCHGKNELSATARMFLTLENLGMRGKVSFLNGGLECWKTEGYPVTKELPVVTKTKFKAKPGELIVDKNYVLNTLKSTTGVVVDARMKKFYDGDPTGNPRDGHIAGAKNIPYTELFDKSNMFKPTDQNQPLFTTVSNNEKELVAYCFIGQTASVVYLVGRSLGYNMKLYDGSIQEWSRIEELPMEKSEQ